MSSEDILVAVRARPLNERERKYATDNGVGWIIDPERNTIRQDAEGKQSMSFDRVFSEDACNIEVYDTIAKPVVQAVLDGINGTIFAYGQTSSGKTYSMQGIMDMGIHEIFNRISKDTSRKYAVKASYLEIYNEELTDLLLEPGAAKKNLKIQITESGGTFISGLSEKQVENASAVLALLAQGQSNRQVGATAMNEQSSRSHTIFSLHLASEPNTSLSQGKTSSSLRGSLTSKCNFVDLAGSERASHTQARGQRLKEGAHINKSLLTLGAVIRKLSEARAANAPAQHVPFRDSKLTRILQPALGGNNRTAIVCCITQSAHHLEDTMRTLGFAWRAKRIRNTIEVNEVLDDRQLIAKLRREIAILKQHLTQVTGKPVNISEILGGSGRPGTAPSALTSKSPLQVDSEDSGTGQSSPIDNANVDTDFFPSLASDLVASIDGAVTAAMSAELDTSVDGVLDATLNDEAEDDSSSMDTTLVVSDIRMFALERQNESMRDCINSLSQQLSVLKDQVIQTATAQSTQLDNQESSMSDNVSTHAENQSQSAPSNLVEIVTKSVEAFMRAMSTVDSMPPPPSSMAASVDGKAPIEIGSKRHWTKVMADHRRKRLGLDTEEDFDSFDSDVDQLANAGFFELPTTLKARLSLGGLKDGKAEIKRVRQAGENSYEDAFESKTGCDLDRENLDLELDEDSWSNTIPLTSNAIKRAQSTREELRRQELEANNSAHAEEAAALRQELAELQFVFSQVQKNLVDSLTNAHIQGRQCILELAHMTANAEAAAEDAANSLEMKETELVLAASRIDNAVEETDKLRNRVRDLDRERQRLELEVKDADVRRQMAEAEAFKAATLAEEVAEELNNVQEQSAQRVKEEQKHYQDELARFEKLMRDKSEEIEALKRDLRTQSEVFENAETEKLRLSKQLERALARAKAKEEEAEQAETRICQLEEVQAELAEAQSQIKHLEQRAAATIAERRALADELTQEKTRLGDIEASAVLEIQRAESIQSRAERARAILEQRIEELSEEIAKLQGELIRKGDSARRELEKERARADELDRQLQKERADAERKMLQAADALERATYDAKRDYDTNLEKVDTEWQEKLAKLREQADIKAREDERIYREERRGLELRVLTLEDELEQAKSEMVEREDQLTVRLKNAMDNVARAEESRQEAEARAYSLETELQTELENVSNAQTLAAERERIARAEASKEAMEDARQEIEKAQQRELESEQRANKERRNASEALARAQAAERAASDHASDSERARSERDMAVREREAAKLEVAQVKRVCDQLRVERDALQQECEALRSHVTSAKSAAEQERALARRKQKELESNVLSGVEIARKEEAEAWQLKLERMQATYHAKERELSQQLESREEELTRLHANYLEETQTLKRHLNEYRAKVAREEQNRSHESTEQIDVLKEELSRLNSIVASTSRTLTEKDEAVRRAHLRLEDMESISARLTSAEDQARKYKQAAMKYKDQIGKLTADCEAGKRELNSLSTQLEDARALNENYVSRSLALEQRVKDYELGNVKTQTSASSSGNQSSLASRMAKVSALVNRHKEKMNIMQGINDDHDRVESKPISRRFAIDDDADDDYQRGEAYSASRKRGNSQSAVPARSRSSSRDTGRELTNLKETRIGSNRNAPLLDMSFENDNLNLSTISDIDSSEVYDSAPSKLPSRGTGSKGLSRANSNTLNLISTDSVSSHSTGSSAISLKPTASSSSTDVAKRSTRRQKEKDSLPPPVSEIDSTMAFRELLQFE